MLVCLKLIPFLLLQLWPTPEEKLTVGFLLRLSHPSPGIQSGQRWSSGSKNRRQREWKGSSGTGVVTVMAALWTSQALLGALEACTLTTVDLSLQES